MRIRRVLLVRLVLSVAFTTIAHAQVRPSLAKAFTSSTVAVSAFTNLTIQINNSANGSAFTNLGFSDPLPAGLSISAAVMVQNTCGGTLTAFPVATTITLVGGAIAANAVCVVIVPIQADAAGLKRNTVTGTGDLAGLTGIAETTVIAPVFTKNFSPTSIFVGQTTLLTLTLTNDVTPAVIFGAVSGFTDNLPAGLVVTSLNSNTCDGTVTTTSTSITLTQAGADSLQPGSCSIVFTLTGVTHGAKVNTAIGNRALSGQNPMATVNVIPPQEIYQVRYAANLTEGDGVINITNTGANGASLTGPGFGGEAGNICVNIYAFSPDEQLIACCSCLVTPNGLSSLSVVNDLLSNTLTGVRPNSVVVKLVNTGAGPTYTGTSCNSSAAIAGSTSFPLAPGLKAFGTSIQRTPVAGSFRVTETPFSQASLSPTELASITNRCTNILGNASTFGICSSCRVGGLVAAK